MNNNKLLNQIGNLIDNKLQPLKKDMNVMKQDMNGIKKVDQSQEETIQTLSELIHSGYNLHRGE